MPLTEDFPDTHCHNVPTPLQLSTYALNTFRKETEVNGVPVTIGGASLACAPCDTTNNSLPPQYLEFWDTAGQEKFNNIHPAYYESASACILVSASWFRHSVVPGQTQSFGWQVFDVTRKATYQHLSTWYEELRSACGNIPCLLVANKIDFDYKVDGFDQERAVLFGAINHG